MGSWCRCEMRAETSCPIVRHRHRLLLDRMRATLSTSWQTGCGGRAAPESGPPGIQLGARGSGPVHRCIPGARPAPVEVTSVEWLDHKARGHGFGAETLEVKLGREGTVHVPLSPVLLKLERSDVERAR